FVYSAGTIRAIARIGQQLVGAYGEQWEEIDSVSLNRSGAVAFTAVTRSTLDGERHEGVFLADGRDPRIILLVGDEVPGLDGPLTELNAVSLNDQGVIASLAWAGEDQSAILLTSGADTQVLAAAGGEAQGGTWAEFDSVALNDSGVVAFEAQVTTDSGD